MSIKPAHIPIGRLVETSSTSSISAGQFIWKNSEFEVTSSISASITFRVVVFSDTGANVSASLSTIDGTEIALLTSVSAAPVSLTTIVDLEDNTIYEVKIASETINKKVTLGSAELEIS